jgi:tRNA threonylcarbamoyladenosine biosynthesis protein TsaB
MALPSEPKLLLIETSGAVGRVGLGRGSMLADEATLDRERRHTRDLIPQCQRLLEKNHWSIKNMDGFVVSWGPGSYTGLRVGLMTGKTLAYALNKPLITVPTFEVLALQSTEHVPAGGSVNVIGDAQQDRLYTQTWLVEGKQRIVEIDPLTLIEGKDWRAALGDVWITGPGLRQQKDKLGAGANPKCLPEVIWDPLLKGLLDQGLERYTKQIFADAFTVEPLYLRPSAAEVKWAELGR